MNYPTSVTDLFTQLCAIRSVSGEEQQVYQEILDFAHAQGIEVIRDTGGNLILTKGTKLPALLLNAHVDTVPHIKTIEVQEVAGLLTNKNGEILGADNKAAVAAMLFFLLGYDGEQQVQLVLTYGEETDFGGSTSLDLTLLNGKQGYVFDTAQPIGTIVQHTGTLLEWEVVCTSMSGHSGLTYPNPMVQQFVKVGEVVAAMAQLPDSRCNVAQLQSEAALNVISPYMRFAGEFRSMNPVSAHKAQDLLNGLAGDMTTVKITVCGEGYFIEESESASLCDVLESFNKRVVLQQSYGLSDVHVLRSRGLKLINCGNGARFTHSANEQIAVEDLELMVTIIERLVATF
jgi:di/tripeptidase